MKKFICILTLAIVLTSCTVTELADTGTRISKAIIDEFTGVKEPEKKPISITLAFPENTFVFNKNKWYKKKQSDNLIKMPYSVKREMNENYTYFIIETESVYKTEYQYQKHFGAAILTIETGYSENHKSMKTFRIPDSNGEYIVIRYLETADKQTLIIKRVKFSETIMR